ncbi:MAG: branched-chain amino acid aminotransferase [Propionibacteriaceae bacterium]
MTRIDVQLSTNPVPAEQRAAMIRQPAFGAHYSDHIGFGTWTRDKGWHDLCVRPLTEFRMHPANGVFHYAQEIFEGMKAYRRPDGVWLFRPEKNAARFAKSARRLSMPALDESDFLAVVEKLVEVDQEWVPAAQGEQSLYLRPFMIADENFLGVRAAERYTFCVVATPVGPYYPHPVKLWATPNFTRAARGGTGDAKCGGNYGASLIAAEEAHENGCDQVIWLDGAEHHWVEECGTMNIMFITSDNELVTPALGTILDGITRDSILTLAAEHGLTPIQRRISIDEVFERVTDGSIQEVFACGTAAVVTPVIGFKAPGRDEVTVADGAIGSRTTAIRQHLLDIQYGQVTDTYNWTTLVGK